MQTANPLFNKLYLKLTFANIQCGDIYPTLVVTLEIEKKVIA